MYAAQLDTGHVGQHPRQQACLQRLGDLRTPPGAGPRGSPPPAERRAPRPGPGRDLERSLAGLAAQRDDPIGVSRPRSARSARRSRRASSSAARCPAGAEHPASPERACSRDFPDSWTCQGRERFRVGIARGPGDRLRFPAGGPTANWRRSPAAHDIDDHPGRELPGQQARAALQGQRFAACCSPGAAGSPRSAVHPARHGLHGPDGGRFALPRRPAGGRASARLARGAGAPSALARDQHRRCPRGG